MCKIELREERDLPVPPVVRTLGVLLIIHIIVGHQQVFAFQLVFVVIIHVRTDTKTVIRREKKTLIITTTSHIRQTNRMLIISQLGALLYSF